MDSEIQKLFQKALYYPESRLSGNILLSIENINKRNIYIKILVYKTIGVLSFVGFFASAKLLFTDFVKSGFYEYISLAFSGVKSFYYWKEIIFSISESLPIASIILSLSLFFIFISSLNFIAMNTKFKNNLSLAY